MNKYFYKVACEHFGFGLTLSVNVIWQLSRGLTLGQAALIEAIALATRVVLDVPTGQLSDRYGRKPVLVGASILFFAGYGIMSQARSFASFLLAAILLALGFCLMSGSEEAYLYEMKTTDYRTSLSRMTMVDEAATIIGLIVSALVVRYYGIQSSILVAAFSMLVTIIVGLIVIVEPAKARSVSESIPNLSKVISRSKNLLKAHTPAFAVFLCLAVYYEGGRVLWQPRLTEAGLAVQYLGVAFAAFKVASLIGAYVARHQRHTDVSRELIWIGFFMAGTFALMSTASLIAVMLGFIVYFFTENIYRIAQSQYLQQLAGEGNRATILSVASFIRSGYSIATLPILGFLSQGGNTRYGFLLLLALQMLAALALIPLTKNRTLQIA